MTAKMYPQYEKHKRDSERMSMMSLNLLAISSLIEKSDDKRMVQAITSDSAESEPPDIAVGLVLLLV